MAMTLDEYQALARKTAIYPADCAVDYCIHGLTSEAGEVAGKWKKVLRDNGGVLTMDKAGTVAGELGDVLWYVANLAFELGVSLQDLANENVRKLHDRQNRGVLSGSGDNR
jgi:NTP pyrophosphatase (non-canonical NTP hydrolase)